MDMAEEVTDDTCRGFIGSVQECRPLMKWNALLTIEVIMDIQEIMGYIPHRYPLPHR